MLVMLWCTHTVQADMRHLLAEPDINTGRTDAVGQPLGVLKLLEMSFSQLKSVNHK